MVSTPAAETVDRKCPRPRSSHAGRSASAAQTCAITWTSIAWRQSAPATPALAQNRSTSPRCSRDAATRAATAAGSATSAATARPSRSAATRRAPSRSRSLTTTRAPRSANARARPAPIPDAPPVTTTPAPTSASDSAITDLDDDPAGRPARGQVGEPVDGVHEGQPPGDQRTRGAGVGQSAQLGVGLAHQLRRQLLVAPPVQAEDAVPLDQQMVRGGLGELAAREADDHDAPVEGDHLRRRDEGLPADRVVHDIGATVADHGLERGDEVTGGPVDDVVGAQPASDLRLRLTAHDGHDAGTGRLAELDGGAPHTAGRRVHEQLSLIHI